MSDTLYKTVLYKSNAIVIGESASNDSDRTDFETHKATAIPVDEIVIAGTTIIVTKTYTDFEALIDGVIITWANVRYIETFDKYELNLII